MIRQVLDSSWTLVALDGVPDAWRGRDLPATVPGCVHTDLLAAGLIPDPYLERNELELLPSEARTIVDRRCRLAL
ncbi:MAG: hypothetical protein KGZ60_03010 [Truepera sp.]|nr:hypothetical protein [Truepera sp.]